MAYDAVAESLRLIESRELTPVTSLSRRRRHAAMAVDVSEDVAVTMFARRSVGCNVEETHVFARHDGEWVILGGGGGGALDNDALHERPAELPARRSASLGVDPRILALEGAGGILDGHHKGWWTTRGRWVNYVLVRVNVDVAHLVLEGRQIAVPWHGRCVVAWPGRRAQRLSILGHDGRQLGQVRLDPSP